MIPGGIANKLGNRYEAKWVVRSLLDVIADKAVWLNFESVDTEYGGFEFAVGRGNITEWHQTKINSPHGNWTINSLKKEGVLRAFASRLSEDSFVHCYFVSQDNSKNFRIVTEKARITNSLDQFIDELSRDQYDSFLRLNAEWEKDDDITYDWLKRSFFELIPEKELNSLIETYGDLYFHNGGKQTYPILRDILEDNFNKKLTSIIIRDAIKVQRALTFKEWAFDPTIEQKLVKETEAYLQTYTPFGVGGETIVRSQSNILIDELQKKDGARLILLTGIAGCGKSGIIRSVINQVRELEIPHLAFRIDHYLSCSTREELGKKLTNREESPVSTLKGAFPDVNSILFIDQVDAVSEVSGRDGQVKEVIFRLIEDANNFGNISIVIGCRTFDLNSDPRLKGLKESNWSKQIDVPLLDWTTDVEPLLKNKGVNISLLREPQQLLLCLPINLAVFLEIDSPDFSFQSRSQLHEKLIEKKQRNITIKWKPQWSLIEPLSDMCEWMSQRQKLSAPSSILDTFPNAVDILISEALIISSRGQVNLFHESFFDHVFARTFVIKNKSLIDLLLETEQHLFRRTQIRQILESLRQNDFDRYLSELSSVLFSDKIRFHLKNAICHWLSSIDKPTEQEFEIISQFDSQQKKFHQLFRITIMSSPFWFNLLNSMNWIHTQLEVNDHERSESILIWLSNIAGEFPGEVTHLMRSWWSGDPYIGDRILKWFGNVRRNKPDEILFQLYDEIINTHPVLVFPDNGDYRYNLLFHTILKKPLKCSGQILQSIFNAWFTLYPREIPFNSERVNAFDTSVLKNFAEKEPLAFLDGTTDALALSIDIVIEESDSSEGGSSNQWPNLDYRFSDDDFLRMYRSAFNIISNEDPKRGAIFLEKLDPHKHKSLMHLHLEAIQFNPSEFSYLLPELALNSKVFNSGWHGAEWLSFANACHMAFPYLKTEKKNIIEKAIFDHTPEIELAIYLNQEINQGGETKPYWTTKHVIHQLNKSKYEQWCILETISEDLLSPRAQMQLHQLRRKFAGETIAKPTRVEAGLVSSPIKKANCERMNDNNWLSAIKHYESDDDKFSGRNFLYGGASQLARELQGATKNNPTRFSNLILKIPDNAHKSYIENILWGLAEADDPSDEALIQAINRAHKHPEKCFGRGIARLLNKSPHIAADPEILELLIWYALNGEANENIESNDQSSKSETISINTLVNRSDSLHFRGINSTRGSAWEAIGSLLWHIPEAEDQVWNTIDNALENELVISVRCCIMNPLTYLFNKDKVRFSDSIHKLIKSVGSTNPENTSLRLSPLITHMGLRLFPYIFHWLPELAQELTSELLESGDETIEKIGAWLIFCESFRNDLYIDKADKLGAKNLDNKRLLASVASEAINWDENRYRVDTLLKGFFSDDDKQIRSISADAFRNVKPNKVELIRNIATEFIQSPAFAENSFPFFHMLDIALCDVLDLVIDATLNLIKGVQEKGYLKGQYGTDFHQVQNLLKREYTSSEGNAVSRKKILDLIDLMLVNEIYGAETIVTAHDR